jgi:hypothetical protein
MTQYERYRLPPFAEVFFFVFDVAFFLRVS